VLIIEAIKQNVANSTQWNFELKTPDGDVYAIKIEQHRFYTLVKKVNGYRELFICRYGKKESQTNSKKLTNTIESIAKLEIETLLK